MKKIIHFCLPICAGWRGGNPYHQHHTKWSKPRPGLSLGTFTLVYTCLHLFTLVYTCLHMFSFYYTFLHLFTLHDNYLGWTAPSSKWSGILQHEQLVSAAPLELLGLDHLDHHQVHLLEGDQPQSCSNTGYSLR